MIAKWDKSNFIRVQNFTTKIKLIQHLLECSKMMILFFTIQLVSWNQANTFSMRFCLYMGIRQPSQILSGRLHAKQIVANLTKSFIICPSQFNNYVFWCRKTADPANNISSSTFLKKECTFVLHMKNICLI